MNESSSKSIPILLVVLAAAFGIYTFTTSTSPVASPSPVAAPTPVNDQDVTARLWEDPLQAVNAEIAAQKNGDKWKRPLTGGFTNDTSHILIVSVPETSFPDDLEVRLRMRYAVQMALTSQGYGPDNGSALGYFTADLNDQKRTLAIPYERFSQRTGGQPVLLLWLPEVILTEATNTALTVLSKLRSHWPKARAFQFIGPRASDTLKSMIETTKPSGDLSNLATNFRIFSPAATAPDYLLNENLTLKAPREAIAEQIKIAIATNSPGAKTENLESDSPWTFFDPVIATDDQLTDLIVKELDLRQVRLFKKDERPPDDLLVLAEADTSYGNSLPIALRSSIATFANNATLVSGPPTITSMHFRNAQKTRTPVKIFRYLRGLDQHKGNAQPPKSAERTLAKSPEEALTQALNKEGPMSLGESQLDYVERLAQAVRADLGRNVKAIGILGSDVYDKLILLRSLRSKFPNAVFFTTDLDARMWHPDYLSFTRNLVVASSGDLRGQFANIPPFRDNYQAALFDACLRALATNTTKLPEPRTPKLFELGRGGPLGLSLPDAATLSAPAVATFDRIVRGILFSILIVLVCLRIFFRRKISNWTAAIGKWVLACASIWRFLSWSGFTIAICAAIAMLCFATSSQDRSLALFILSLALCFPAVVGYARSTHGGLTRWLGNRGPLFIKDVRFLVGVCLALILLIAFVRIAVVVHMQGEESFSWTSGASAWPTEIIRLCVLSIAILAIAGAWARHLDGRVKIKKKFSLKADDSLTQPFWRPLWGEWPKSPDANTTPDDSADAKISKNEEADASKIYDVYISKAQFRCRITRSALATAIYLCFWFAIVFWVEGGMPDQTHIRGVHSVKFDLAIMVISASAFVFLVFYVMDAVTLTGRMLSCITGRTTSWPDDIKTKKAAERRLREDDVPGLIDVQFAAAKSGEIRALIILPLLMQFLFIIARNPYFDNWSWPPVLIAIFTSNMLLAVFTWIKLRRVAKRIRSESLNSLDAKIQSARCAVDQDRFSSEHPRLRGLLRLRQEIANEKSGAYSNFIQDPTVVAMLFPSSALTILLILIQALFRG